METKGENSNEENKETGKTRPNYGCVKLTLENCFLPLEKLQKTPSFCDGLSEEHEYDLRILGCELIQTSGILLKLPQVAMATGQVLFHRFYYSKSFVRYPMEVTAMACITLASKIEEAPRRIRDVINVFHHMKQIRNEQECHPLVLDQNYINLKNQVIKAERRLLKELGFCVHIKHPHKFIVTLLQVLESEKNHRLMQTAWNYMNDSLRTDVFVRYTPETIACSCIYLSARVLRIPLPRQPAWFEIFGVSETEIQEVCRIILKLYTRGQPNQELLDEVVGNLRKEYEKMKQKSRIIVENGISPGKAEVDATTKSPTKQSSPPANVEKEEQSEKSRRNTPESPKKSSKPNNK
ncbi:cyclin-L1-like isoform X1, partial [Dinothrombium tinctorium]